MRNPLELSIPMQHCHMLETMSLLLLLYQYHQKQCNLRLQSSCYIWILHSNSLQLDHLGLQNQSCYNLYYLKSLYYYWKSVRCFFLLCLVNVHRSAITLSLRNEMLAAFKDSGQKHHTHSRRTAIMLIKITNNFFLAVICVFLATILMYCVRIFCFIPKVALYVLFILFIIFIID